MAIPYEPVVEQDLARGYGSVVVSMPGGGSAVGRKIGIHSFLGNFVNVKDFGAVGDGSTNDSDAIATADAALGTTGGTVYFPAGTYNTTRSLTPRTGVTRVGEVLKTRPARLAA